ncbi:AI-2E family transporter [Haliangium sp.]|uniref:AI-2E family transporter n=1 Tax=Haliangium sp. TaxID=2663208 RepID=UPI003D0FB415
MPASNSRPPLFDPKTASHRRVITMIRWLLYLAFVVIAFVVLRHLAPVLTPILAAAGIAYLLDPWVDWLEARGLKRVLAVALLLVSFIGALVAAVLTLTPLMAADASSFIEELPAMLDSSQAWLQQNLGYELPVSWESYLESEQMSSLLHEVAGPASSIAAAAIGGVFGVIGALAEILLVPVFAFYFLVDWDHMVVRARGMIPPRHRGEVISAVVDIDAVVSSWLRGQFTVVLIQAILYATCFYLLDVRLAISVGLLVGLLTIIPFLGTVVGAIITVTLVLLDWQGPGQLLGVGAVFVVLHLFEAAVLTPRIVGKRVGLGETGALFAVVAGGQLLGFTGVLLAVPLAASVAVLLRRLIRYYEDSQFFGANDTDDSVPAPPTSLPRMAAAVAISLDSAEMQTRPDPAELGPAGSGADNERGHGDDRDDDDGERGHGDGRGSDAGSGGDARGGEYDGDSDDGDEGSGRGGGD